MRSLADRPMPHRPPWNSPQQGLGDGPLSSFRHNAPVELDAFRSYATETEPGLSLFDDSTPDAGFDPPSWQDKMRAPELFSSIVASSDQSTYPQAEPSHKSSQSSISAGKMKVKPMQEQLHLPPPERPSRLDPFEYLGDVEAGLIIASLPDADLETLRRVSKTWKRYSEYFNRYSSIRERFSWANEHVYEAGGSEVANLQFRRHLHHNESLRKGFATRVIRMKNLLCWHVDERSLVWIDQNWNLKFRDLRSETFGPVSPDILIEVPFAESPLRSLAEGTTTIQVDSLHQTENRDVIVCMRTQNEASKTQTSSYPVLRISREGETRWIFAATFHYLRSNFALGKTHLYSLDASKLDADGRPRVCLVKRNLDSGFVSKWIPVRGWNGDLGQPCLWEIGVTQDDRWLTCSKGQGFCNCIISTETGSLVRRLGDRNISNATSFVAAQPHGTGTIWEQEESSTIYLNEGKLSTKWVCFRSTYDSDEGCFYRQRTEFAYASEHLVSGLTDPERKLAFCLTRAPAAGVAIVAMSEIDETGTFVANSDRWIGSGKCVTTRARGLNSPNSMRKQVSIYNGSIQMVANYLVRSDWRGKSLAILDFWPRW